MLKSFLLPTLQECKKELIILFVSLLVITVTQSIFLLLVGPTLNVLFSEEQEVFQLTQLSSLGSFLPALAISKMTILIWLPIVISTVGLVKVVFNYLYRRNQHYLSLWIAKNLRERLFSAILARPYTSLLRKSSAEWMSIIMNDTLFLQMRFSDIMTCFIKNTAQIVACVVVLAAIHYQSAIILVFLAIVVGISLRKISQKIASFAQDYQEKLAIVSAKILDLRKRFEFIKSQGAKDYEMQEFSRYNRDYYCSIRRSIFMRSSLSPISEFVGVVIFSLILLLVSQKLWMVETPQVTIVQFLVALGFILKPLKNFSEQLSSFQETKGALLASLEILQTQSPKTLDNHNHNYNKKPLDKEFVIEYLSVSYDNLEHEIVFQNLPVTFGKIIAFVGSSGTGKTTLAKSLAGLLVPTRWHCKHTYNDVIRNVSYASQKPFMFHDTIVNNLTYGQDTESFNCLDKIDYYLHAFEFERKNTDKFDPITPNLSGGQIQKLTIIRALLQPASIIVLDEVTSAIDMRMEKKIIFELKNIAREQNKFVLAITHRQNLLSEFDQVWFASSSSSLLRGSHAGLLQKYGSYQKFCQNT